MEKYSTTITQTEEVKLENPIVLEGLPGIGFVGKITVDEIIKQYEATKFAELISDYFPPQVTLKSDGIIEHMRNEFYCIKDFGEENQDIILLTGNTQGSDFEGQTAVCKAIMEFLEKFNPQKIYTLGGIGTGEMIEKSKILVAGNNKESIDEILNIGNTQLRIDDGGVIIGASGLLLFYAQQRDIPAACLMGETPGFYIDPASAKELITVLTQLLKFDFDFTEITEKAEDTLNKIIKNQNLQSIGLEPPMPQKGDDLHYIG